MCHNTADRANAKRIDCRQLLNAHECMVNEVNPFILRPSTEEARGRRLIRGGVFPDGGSRGFPRSRSAEIFHLLIINSHSLVVNELDPTGLGGWCYYRGQATDRRECSTEGSRSGKRKENRLIGKISPTDDTSQVNEPIGKISPTNDTSQISEPIG
ncbi:hypothetical protein LR48_Vigan07g198200 [Vigna angularis]|uniref:Uncharacterized protein n=1 Tax=Phaseolus angularis TaxID=3914 RepID=A0A0L9UZS2_PHAAN|nr:hypothetical protein LR48_Vigan07g198200 [Vigna angularis]